MPEDTTRPTSFSKEAKVIVRPGQPLEFADLVDATSPDVSPNPLDIVIGRTLAAYTKAARKLLDGKYAGLRELTPPHMQGPCSITVLRCDDGILVRYERAEEGKARLAGAYLKTSLAQAAPMFSEQVIHFPPNPQNYVPASGGPEITLSVTRAESGTVESIAKLRPLIYATAKLPDGFQMPQPPARPPCLVSVVSEIDLQIEGVSEPLEQPGNRAVVESEHFVTHSRFRLPVGWQAIEIYPMIGEEYWRPEYAPNWAELDLLAAIAQRNVVTSRLKSLDSRGETRKLYAALLEEFKTLLDGPEEPVHQFLKQHPELLCPTKDRFWSKLPFGDRFSDFVFREPHNDYLLVEIEAPIRDLFRKDGQQREELTHAINQITDWIQYIADNKQKVEEELGLTGISTNPRTLVVVGRSGSLTEENRQKIATLQALQNKLRILTYDDLIATARANLERILGPLDVPGQNVEIYYFKEPIPPIK